MIVRDKREGFVVAEKMLKKMKKLSILKSILMKMLEGQKVD